MTDRILQVSFTLTIPTAEWEGLADSLTTQFVEMPGLHWKIWLVNAETGEAGGIYCFESDDALRAFLDGPIPAQLATAPFQRDLRVTTSEVLEAPTRLTRGPVGSAVPVGAA